MIKPVDRPHRICLLSKRKEEMKVKPYEKGIKTHITMVLDRSGSMGKIASDAEPAVNKFVEDQKKVVGKCTFTLVQFDNKYEIPYNGVDIQEVKEIKLRPRSMTALLDAVGRAINETGEFLDKMKEEDRPDKVIVVIMTDGLENASCEFKKGQVNGMVKHQQEVYNWEFVYLGANQDAFKEAQDLGINVLKNTKSYHFSGQSYAGTMSDASDAVRFARESIDNKVEIKDADKK